MRKWFEISASGLDALLQNGARSWVTIACVVAILTPYLAATGVAKGVQQQAELAIDAGADLYISGQRFGQHAAIPFSAAAAVEKIEGVERVVPRILGRQAIGAAKKPAIVVGIDPGDLPNDVQCIRGRLFQDKYELLVGTELARDLHFEVGSRVPPFFHGPDGDRVATVVGIFTVDVSLWQANVLFTSRATAAEIFGQETDVTDLAVYCRPGYEPSVAAAVRRDPPWQQDSRLSPTAITRSELQGMISKRMLHREGIFQLRFLLALAVGIPVVLITSGIAQRERRRETGILKAVGWQTDEILLRSFVENSLLSLAAAALSILIAWFWLRVFNGAGVAGLFLSGAGLSPDFRTPFVLLPGAALIGVLLALVIVLAGTLVSTWKAAIAPPGEAMR